MTDASKRLTLMEAIFHEALAVEPEQRPARLLELCGEDDPLLAEVSRLVRAAEREQLTSGAKRSQLAEEKVAFAQRRIGPYQLQSLLGRGGTGAVYLAQRADGQYTKTVAIKLIDVPLATELFRDRFRQERQILAGLDHPLIARLLDGGVSDQGSPYLVMDHVSGVPIDEYCRQHTLNIRQRLRLFLLVCEAVQFAHQNLVVHRDLKPDNILVSEDGKPHLLDFGTAKLLSPEEATPASQSTREGFLSFTPQYASPEQVLGQPVTVSSDIYSLGVLLFVLLTGRYPYKLADFSTEEMLRVIVNQPPARPGAGETPFGRIDADLDSIVLKALRKKSAERYLIVDQIAADITAYLERRPVQARRGSLRYKVSKFALRNRLALSGAVVLALILIASMTAVAWSAHTAAIARRKAEARAADLRVLSGSFLSELDDAIQQLPGSTSAQQLLVKRVGEHVERMSQDDPLDLPTQLDAADAYIRLANLQGNPYDQNIGDPKGALMSIDRAMLGLDHVRSQNPDDPALLHAYAFAFQSRGEILYGMRRTTDALQASTTARDLYVRLASSPVASSLAMSEAATSEGNLADEIGQEGVNSLGDGAGALARQKAVLAWDNRALEKDPDSIRARRALPVALMKLARLQAGFDPSGAVDQYRGALEALDRYPAVERQSYAFGRLQALINRNMALALLENGDYIAANRIFEESRAVAQAALHADPTNARDADDLFVVDENEAECLEAMASPASGLWTQTQDSARRQAIDRLVEARSITEQARKRNANDLRGLDLDAYLEFRIGVLLQRHGSSTEGKTMVSHAVATLRKLAADTTAHLSVFDYETTALLNALPVSLRDPIEATRAAEWLVMKTNHQKPSYLLQLARAYQASGRGVEAKAVAGQALALLSPVRPGAPSSSTRKELDALVANR